jgi:hypothetical protein
VGASCTRFALVLEALFCVALHWEQIQSLCPIMALMSRSGKLLSNQTAAALGCGNSLYAGAQFLWGPWASSRLLGIPHLAAERGSDILALVYVGVICAGEQRPVICAGVRRPLLVRMAAARILQCLHMIQLAFRHLRRPGRQPGAWVVAALGPGGIVMCRFARLVLRSGGFAPTRTAFFFFVTLEGVTRPPSP